MSVRKTNSHTDTCMRRQRQTTLTGTHSVCMASWTHVCSVNVNNVLCPLRLIVPPSPRSRMKDYKRSRLSVPLIPHNSIPHVKSKTVIELHTVYKMFVLYVPCQMLLYIKMYSNWVFHFWTDSLVDPGGDEGKAGAAWQWLWEGSKCWKWQDWHQHLSAAWFSLTLVPRSFVLIGWANFSKLGVTQLVERRTQDPMDFHDLSSNHIRSTRTNCESFSESKVLCRLTVGMPNAHVYIYARTHKHDHISC